MVEVDSGEACQPGGEYCHFSPHPDYVNQSHEAPVAHGTINSRDGVQARCIIK
jgi:hypothetical protein